MGNLAYALTVDQLRECFQIYGRIRECKIVPDKATGRSAGFGFVEFEDPQSAFTALDKLDGHELAGRQMRVREAQNKSREGHGGQHRSSDVHLRGRER